MSSNLLKRKHSPTLNTVLMVENTLKKSDKSVMTIAEIKRNLPKQVNHAVLKVILEYLEHGNKIAVSLKGITWIDNRYRKMRQALQKSFDYPEDFLE